MRILITKWRWWHGALPLLVAVLAGCGAYGGPATSEEEHSSEEEEAHVTVRTEPARLGTFDGDR